MTSSQQTKSYSHTQPQHIAQRTKGNEMKKKKKKKCDSYNIQARSTVHPKSKAKMQSEAKNA